MNRWLQAGMLPVPGGYTLPPLQLALFSFPDHFTALLLYHLFLLQLLRFGSLQHSCTSLNHVGLNGITKYKNLLLYYY